MFHARSESMIRFVACTAIACLAASCVPPKAILVEAAPVEKPKGEKPAVATMQEAPAPPQVAVRSGMRVPDPAGSLPDQKDFAPTAQAPSRSGGVIASPPSGSTPDKRVNE